MPNYDQRLILDNRFGQLAGGVVASATVLSSPEFATLPSDLSAVRYLPIVLADDASKVYEIVWATGHVEGSQNITVVRGREGSAARVWGVGTAWRGAQTVRDGISTVANRAALPADPHLGMKVVLRDENRVVERTGSGWKTAETIFGHAGRTSGFQAGPSGTLTVVASQDLQGGMSFAAGALVVPIAGRYLCIVRGYCTGTGTGRFTANMRVNGALTAPCPGVQAAKIDGNDHSAQASTVMALAAGDTLTAQFSAPTNTQTWGTTGYDGAWIEALYVGP